MSISHGIAIFAAAFAAGVMNSVAGGGTLITFSHSGGVRNESKNRQPRPAPLRCFPALRAECGAIAEEMDDTRSLMIRLAIPSIIGGAAGAGLLMITPVKPHSPNLVPYLILFATAIFIAQEPISRHLRKRRIDADPTIDPNAVVPSRAWWIGAMTFQFWVAVYGGYFGAGIGILNAGLVRTVGCFRYSSRKRGKDFSRDMHKWRRCSQFHRVFAWSTGPEALLMSIGARSGRLRERRYCQTFWDSR